MSRIIVNAFVMNTPAHLSTGMWRFPGDTSHRHGSLSHWMISERCPPEKE
jgi:hypothetical protein